MSILDDIQTSLSTASAAASNQVQKSLQNTTLGNLGNAVLDVVNPLPNAKQRVVDSSYSSTVTLVYVGVAVLVFYYWRKR